MNGKQRIKTENPFLTADRIEAALRRPLPGRAAQICMAPVPRPLDPPTPPHRPRRAGVLLLLYATEEKGELCLVLTRRTESVADHKGQISLPGGAVDPGDPSTAHTALREACEEIGVCEDDVRLLGGLTPSISSPAISVLNLMLPICLAGRRLNCSLMRWLRCWRCRSTIFWATATRP